MNFLNMSQDEIDRSGARWMTHEISQQPQIWSKAQQSMAREASATREFLDPLLRRRELQIVLTGAGTAACIGECLAPAPTRQLGMRVQAIATTDLVAALEVAEQVCADCRHLIITCNREWLAREAALKMLELTDGRVVAVSDTANALGVVNRLAQGVSIYAWDPHR